MRREFYIESPYSKSNINGGRGGLVIEKIDEKIALNNLRVYINIKIDFNYNKSFEEFMKVNKFIITPDSLVEQSYVYSFIRQTNDLHNEIYKKR